MKYVLLPLCMLVCVAQCFATPLAPVITVQATNLGGGLVAYDIGLDDPNIEPDSPFGVAPGGVYQVDMTFTGNINQLLAFPGSLKIGVNTDTDAKNWSIVPGSGYDMNLDTWVYSNQFTSYLDPVNHQPLTGFAFQAIEGPGSFHIVLNSGAVSTGGELKLDTVTLLHIVASGPIEYSGDIARGIGGTAYPYSYQGVINVPEPGTFILLAIGTAALVCSRRRGLNRCT
jgi:hypothetical protein